VKYEVIHGVDGSSTLAAPERERPPRRCPNCGAEDGHGHVTDVTGRRVPCPTCDARSFGKFLRGMP
jgi:DNA-directed RNA polymerase subunit RPC12/RpoP